MSESLIVNEIFLSIQGEGVRAGRPCVLVRLTGCDVGCAWCDTRYAWDEGRERTVAELCHEVAALRCPLVEVTGGEPLMQPATEHLLAALCDGGFEVLLETSGTRAIAGVDRRVARIVDVKCPSSGAAEKMLWNNLDELRNSDEVKFVIADRADYGYAREVVERRGLAGRCPVSFSPVADRLDAGALASWILHDRLPVRLNLQLHRILWPDKESGV